MRLSGRSRGFTLLELLVGAAVGSVVLLGISLTFISQAQQYQSHASRRGLQANARQALGFMERHLRVAGYGVDPDRAIIPYDSYNPVTDAQDLGHPDAFVVHWRDPLFRRQVATVDAAHVTITAALTKDIRKGQILLILCDTATSGIQSVSDNPPHVYVTVGQPVAAGQLDIPFDVTPSGAAPNSPQQSAGRLFHEQDVPGVGHPCFTGVIPYKPPQVLLIHRAAFYVAMFDDDGDPTTPERTPYLVMHQGLDMPNATNPLGDGVIDANDAVPVAEGIEQLQVAYILDANTDLILDPDQTPTVLGVETLMDVNHYGENWEQINPGSAPGGLPTGWVFNPIIPDTPNRRYANNREFAAARLLDHPANIRQVRLTLISRSTIPDPQIRGDDLLTMRPDGTSYSTGPNLANGLPAWRHLENLYVSPPATDFNPVGGHFYRTILRQSVAPKNLLMTRQFVPVNPKGGG